MTARSFSKAEIDQFVRVSSKYPGWSFEQYKVSLDIITYLNEYVDNLEVALRTYANEENWRLNRRYDANSPRFDGVSYARAALRNDVENGNG